MPTNIELVKDAILALKKQHDITEFTSADILKLVDVNRKSLGSLLSTMVTRGDIYKLDKPRKNPDGGRGFVIYTTELRKKAEEEPNYEPPPKQEPEPTLNYYDIGKAIVANIDFMRNRIIGLETKCDELQERLDDALSIAKRCNQTISKMREDQINRKRSENNRTFKMSEIAKVK